MDREEKALEQTLDVLIGKLNDSKNSLGSLIARLEDDGTSMEPVSWNSALDSYALISSQINLVLKYLKSDSVPNLRNRVIFPIYLNPDRDEELIHTTEGRVQTVSHDMVPDYLRTRPDMEIEKQELQITGKAALMTTDQGLKTVAMSNKIVDNVSTSVKQWKDDWESESGSGKIIYPATQNAKDTQTIIAAITSGVGLKPESKMIGPGPTAGLSSLPPPAQGPAPGPIKTARIKTKINTQYNRPN